MSHIMHKWNAPSDCRCLFCRTRRAEIDKAVAEQDTDVERALRRSHALEEERINMKAIRKVED